MEESGTKKKRHRRRRNLTECHCCRKEFRFCWECRCGFAICQECMLENFWGLSCNGITWNCPDCEDSNGLGNQ